jgi:hypothetical protein
MIFPVPIRVAGELRGRIVVRRIDGGRENDREIFRYADMNRSALTRYPFTTGCENTESDQSDDSFHER